MRRIAVVMVALVVATSASAHILTADRNAKGLCSKTPMAAFPSRSRRKGSVRSARRSRAKCWPLVPRAGFAELRGWRRAARTAASVRRSRASYWFDGDDRFGRGKG